MQSYLLALGINYGRVVDNLTPLSSVMAPIKNLQVGYIKIYDINPQVLSTPSNTTLQVIIYFLKI